VLGSSTRQTFVEQNTQQNAVCPDHYPPPLLSELVNILITMLVVRLFFVAFVILAQKLRIHMLSMLSIINAGL
jgi:hypothetical protein